MNSFVFLICEITKSSFSLNANCEMPIFQLKLCIAVKPSDFIAIYRSTMRHHPLQNARVSSVGSSMK